MLNLNFHLKKVSVAIDGPAGAGKSSVAKIVAKELGYVYIDTGALYRTIALHVLQCNKSIKEALNTIDLQIRIEDGKQKILLFGNDIRDSIRTAEVTSAASKLSAISEVREFLLEFQQKFAQTYNVVMDGRDIGTTVLPNATVKIFLTASAQVRAKRRYNELCNETVTYDQVLHDIEERDHRDMTREISPLVQAPDAFLMDTSNMTFDEVVLAVLKIIRKRVENQA